MADLRIIQPGMPNIDDCPILTRLKAFVVDQGVCGTLRHTFRDRKGLPVDLSAYFGESESSESSSNSNSISADSGTIQLKLKEWLGCGSSSASNPIWTVDGAIVDAGAGLMEATLDEAIVKKAGIYELNWAVLVDDSPIAVDRGVLSVERSMFITDLSVLYKNLGPPTLQEVRMLMMDSYSSENQFLDDVEFKDEQVLLAMVKPVEAWNEALPPIRTYTTRDFPFRGAWAQGILGQLHMMAAANYRRNFTQGVNPDKDKERQYMAEGQRLWQEYLTWMQHKKISINARLFAGNVQSAYAARAGW